MLLKNYVHRLPNWVRPILKDYKAKAEKTWRYTDSTHFVVSISEFDRRLLIELGPKGCDDIPGAFYWYSTATVSPGEKTGQLYFWLEYRDGKKDQVKLSGWEELVDTLNADLAAYNRRVTEARRKMLEEEIDSLPG